MGLEHARGDDVDRVAQQPLQLDVETGEIEQIGAGLEVDEEVATAGAAASGGTAGRATAGPETVVRTVHNGPQNEQ